MHRMSAVECWILLAMATFPSASNALTQGDYTYTTNALGKATITDFPTSYAGALSIPDNLGGCPVVAIGGSAFRDCNKLTSVTIPSTVTTLGTWAFAACSALANVTIGPNVTSIPDRAFNECSVLKAIVIPDSVRSIGKDAFSRCRKLASAEIGNGVTSIGFAAFLSCDALSAVSIGSGVGTIEDWAFLACPSLKSFTVDPANTTYASLDGVLFNKGMTTLIQYPSAKSGSYAIPSGVTTLGDFAFESCAALTAVAVPDSVGQIGFDAFSQCPALVAFTVDDANSTYSSQDGVLFNKGLTTLLKCPSGKAGRYTIPSGVTTIDRAAFADCAALTSILIPASVTTLEEYAFSRCNALNALLFQGNAPSSYHSLFEAPYELVVYYLPGKTGWGSTFEYKTVRCWNPSFRADAGLGFSGGRFGFTLDGTPQIPVRVEAAIRIDAADWTSVTNTTLGAVGSLVVVDAESDLHPARFYRVVFP